MPVAKLSIMRHKIRRQKNRPNKVSQFYPIFSFTSPVQSWNERYLVISMKWSRLTIQLWGEFCISLAPSNPFVFVFPSNPFVFVFPSHPFQPQEENCLFWLRWAGNCESKWSHCRNENTSNSFGKFIWGAHSSKNCESLSGFLKKIVGIRCFAKGVGKAKGQKIPHSFTLICC